MTASSARSLPTVGFLTVCEQADHSVVGGYLVLNAAGRPLEFHCTVPVRPNRAQEILYGSTLKPYLYGEQIGRTLVSKAASEPLFVCTDMESVMALREHASVPVVLVSGEAASATGGASPAHARPEHRMDVPHRGAAQSARAALVWFPLGSHSAAVSTAHTGDRETVEQHWSRQIEGLDLGEPFTRIREAIEEAQRTPAR
jgi:hypothetical protein